MLVTRLLRVAVTTIAAGETSMVVVLGRILTKTLLAISTRSSGNSCKCNITVKLHVYAFNRCFSIKKRVSTWGSTFILLSSFDRARSFAFGFVVDPEGVTRLLLADYPVRHHF